MMIEWMRGSKTGMASKFFSYKELECKCGVCGPQKMDDDLLNRMDKIREEYGKAIMINRAYSCPEHNKNVGGSAGSNHIKGKAADLRDNDGLIKGWIKDKLIRLGLYMEHPDYTKTWCHVQNVAPPSGNRVFRPR